MPYHVTLSDRFWSKCDRLTTPTGCWGWTASFGPKGHGRFHVDKWSEFGAHRVAYELANGPIHDGLHVLHRCDNPRCVHPCHLFLGTNADNIRDMHAKGRWKGQTPKPRAPIPCMCNGGRGITAPHDDDGLLARRFWNKVIVGAPDECWPWKHAASAKRQRYGRFGIGYKRPNTVSSHHMAWRLTFGPIPEGLWVLHRCDNPPCCNPAHLFLGTAADNAADMRRKNRGATGDRSGPRLYPERLARGESHHLTRLTEADVRAIRAWRAECPKTQFGRAVRSSGNSYAAIARRYCVPLLVVKRIATRQTWKHVE